MKTEVILTALFLCGCATSSQVEQMIDDNNQKIAVEQLKPEFDRLNEQLAELGARLDSLTTRVVAAETSGAGVEETIRSLSLALNKAQGDMGLVQENLDQIRTLAVSQEAAVNQAVAAVDEQKAALIGVFRKQLADLQDVVQQLEGEMEDSY